MTYVSSIHAVDAWLNVETTYGSEEDCFEVSWSGASDAGGYSPDFRTCVDFASGESQNSLGTYLYRAQTLQLTVTDSGAYGYASSEFTVEPNDIESLIITLPGETFVAGGVEGG